MQCRRLVISITGVPSVGHSSMQSPCRPAIRDLPSLIDEQTLPALTTGLDSMSGCFDRTRLAELRWRSPISCELS